MKTANKTSLRAADLVAVAVVVVGEGDFFDGIGTQVDAKLAIEGIGEGPWDSPPGGPRGVPCIRNAEGGVADEINGYTDMHRVGACAVHWVPSVGCVPQHYGVPALQVRVVQMAHLAEIGWGVSRMLDSQKTVHYRRLLITGG
jgi:hypothetical protein